MVCRKGNRSLSLPACSLPSSNSLRKASSSLSRRSHFSRFSRACDLANSAISSSSFSLPPALNWTNSTPASDRPRVTFTVPNARNDAAFTCTIISARAPQSIGRVISTRHPCRLRSCSLPETITPVDGRQLISARPPQLNRGLRRRSSSPSKRSGMFIRSCAEREFLS